jgi:tellurite resistance protein TerC
MAAHHVCRRTAEPPVLAMIATTTWAYVGFGLLIAAFLALDLGIFHRKAHIVSAREAAAWTAVWTTMSVLFTVAVYFIYENHWLGVGLNVPVLGSPGETAPISGRMAVEQYLAGYLVELSLAVDNLFVIAIIFSYFAIPAKYQHRVLFWGILGALVMRGGMIAIGAVLIQRFSWITYLFGGFLVLTAVKMALVSSHGAHPDRNILVRLVRKFFPVTSEYDGQNFFTKVTTADGVVRTAATPLLLALVVVEFTDLVFAADSIPAIFAITADPFLVVTSNAFAILGLRSMYFLLAKLLDKFRFLKPALVIILTFVGIKMLLVHSSYKISTPVSLAVIASVLIAAVVASILMPSRSGRAKAAADPHPTGHT